MLSIIIPFYNEAENLPILANQLIGQLDKLKKEYEIILVDDGSNDNFQFSIFNFQNNIRLIKHKKRLGKGQALKSGIENSKGNIIVFMDGDLQDDPSDLPFFLKKIEEGYYFINGIRKKREDDLFVKIYSLTAKKFLKVFLNSPYTDINCGFKVFKKEVLEDFVFYGNNFRFFPLFVFYNGYKVTEIIVKNNQRKFGKSKFGRGKLLNGIFNGTLKVLGEGVGLIVGLLTKEEVVVIGVVVGVVVGFVKLGVFIGFEVVFLKVVV